MKKKKVEKYIADEFEKELPSSGLSFDSLAAKVDFSKYEKKAQKPIYRKPWFYALTSAAVVVVGFGMTIGIMLGAKKYNQSGNSFHEGAYLFSKISNQYGVEFLPKPEEGDKVVIGVEPFGDTYFALEKSKTGYDGYISFFGALEEYNMQISEYYMGGVKAAFRFDDVDYFAQIYGSNDGDNLYCSITADSRSMTIVYSK